MTEYRIVYPYNKVINEKEVRMKFADAIANDEVDSDYETLDPLTCDIIDAIKALDNTGRVAFARL